VSASERVLEVAIPLASFRKEGGNPDGTTAVLNVSRSRHVRGVPPRENQYFSWSPFVVRSFNEIENFGRIRFVE
jgi:hypothetical protein